MTIMTHSIVLLSDASGDVVATTRVNGYLAAIEIVPDSGGTQPTDQFDITIDTEGGTEIFADTGVGNAATEYSCPALDTYFKYAISGTLTITGANMGNAKGATILLHIED